MWIDGVRQSLRNHQDFYLGPVNEIRHGRYMLVDDYSQYGVGVIYFLFCFSMSRYSLFLERRLRRGRE